MDAPSHAVARPRWSAVLRAVREARGLTLDGWGAQIGVSRATVQRWERGERVPDPAAEAAIVAYCRHAALFRTYDRGPLSGLSLTAELLGDLLADARWRVGGGAPEPADRTPASEPTAVAQPNGPWPDSAVAPPASLPAQLTSFVGREQELADARRAQSGTRLLTLTGAGGSGKTRLALELARELLLAYPHGVYVVELAALADPALVPQTLAAALGLHTSGERSIGALLREWLAPRHLLLVLDNCEHLLPACAELIEPLLRACPHLEILATSREPLGIAGETLWPVRPLSPADAARLFVERARLSQADFRPAPENEAAIAEICARLDGIPLAIELAAVRVRVLSLDGIAERLNDRFHLLTGGNRTALPRHQTLRAALDWSHDLLTAPEQTLFRRLAVFAGGFTLEAAEAVGGNREQGTGNRAGSVTTDPCSLFPVPSHEVLDILTSLVDKSLVIAHHRDDAVRYRLLETVRQYAAERLEVAGEAPAVRDRHRDWCLALAEEVEAAVHTSAEGERLARLEEEHDNLRAALAWSLANRDDRAEAALRLVRPLARFWEVYGHMSEGRQWLAQALAAGVDAPAAVRAKALEGAWWLAYMQADYAAARPFAEQCLALYRDLGDERGIAQAHSQLAGIALRCGEHAEATALMERSLALHTAAGDTWGIAASERGLGILALRQGDYTAALTRLETSLALHRQLGNKEGIANALDDLATVAGEQGEAERQAALLAEALTLFRELRNTGGVALVLGSLGMHALLQGEHDRAEALLDESLALHRERAERRGIGRALANQGLLALQRRDYARAGAFCRDSLALHRELGDRWAIGRSLPLLAAAALGQGRPERAARSLGAAAALRRRLGTRLPRAVQPVDDETSAATRAALGESAFAAAWNAGQALSVEEATEEALTEPA